MKTTSIFRKGLIFGIMVIIESMFILLSGCTNKPTYYKIDDIKDYFEDNYDSVTSFTDQIWKHFEQFDQFQTDKSEEFIYVYEFQMLGKWLDEEGRQNYLHFINTYNPIYICLMKPVNDQMDINRCPSVAFVFDVIDDVHFCQFGLIYVKPIKESDTFDYLQRNDQVSRISHRMPGYVHRTTHTNWYYLSDP